MNESYIYTVLKEYFVNLKKNDLSILSTYTHNFCKILKDQENFRIYNEEQIERRLKMNDNVDIKAIAEIFVSQLKNGDPEYVVELDNEIKVTDTTVYVKNKPIDLKKYVKSIPSN